MTINEIQVWMQQNPDLAFVAVLVFSIIVFFIARSFIANGLYTIAKRTESKYDDMIVESLHPFRVAYIAPFIVIYYFAYLLPEYDSFIRQFIIFLILWVVIITINSLLNAVNQIYESNENYSGVPIQGYLDIVKLLFIIVGLILTISLITGQSPLRLLTGLGALTAVMLLIFRDTILSLVASVQISANDLVKEGDWIEVPSFDADGDVVDMSLNSIKIQNWDNTISVVPTHKMLEVSFKNWRGMQESGGRRIKRAINIDLGSVRFCDDKMAEKFRRIDLIRTHIEKKSKEIEAYNKKQKVDNSELINRRRLTNVGVFRAYIEAYLHNHKDLHQKKMTLIVRQLAPSPTGLPLEVYAFTNTTVWADYEAIQADVFDHLLAVVPEFGLRVFQQPTGLDFRNIIK